MPCLISITGTTGSVHIQFVQGGHTNSIYASVGDSAYIPDGIAAATFTSLEGDATASSSCATLTEVPKKLYQFSWQVPLCATSYTFKELLDGTTSHDLGDLTYDSWSPLAIANLLNEYNLAELRAVGLKIIRTETSAILYLIVEVISLNVPEIKLQGTAATELLFLKGVEVSSVPYDFSVLDGYPPATTTTTTLAP
jgi:hypothetical protein